MNCERVLRNFFKDLREQSIALAKAELSPEDFASFLNLMESANPILDKMDAPILGYAKKLDKSGQKP